MIEDGIKPEPSSFKQAQARYRRQPHAPDRLDDLSDLVDFSRGGDDRIMTVDLNLPENVTCYRGPVYGLRDFPGLLYAPQALAESLQTDLAYAAVSQYCEAPHVTNIDSALPKPSEEDNADESMWELWKETNGHGCGDDNDEDTKQAVSSSSGNKKKYRSFRKLSWATMGYHYDWNARTYHEGAKSPMSEQLAKVTHLFATTSLLANGSNKPPVNYTATACITNYYHGKSVMGGHRDDLELALDKPLVSLSMGRPAVFLMGGKTKDCNPVVPILVRPGDVLIMGGDSRLKYHSMARLLPSTDLLPPVNAHCIPRLGQQVGGMQEGEDAIPTHDRQALASFLQQHRMNMSVRQVYSDQE
jgi:alkylated DNA repair protein alkB family protein 1